MAAESDFLATSIAGRLLMRMTRTHDRRRISVFSGPPGIGKSTAIERFRSLNDGRVAVIQLEEGPDGGHKAASSLQFAVAAVSRMVPRSSVPSRIPRSPVELRSIFYYLASEWVGLSGVSRHLSDPENPPRCTIVVDEAQNSAREGLGAWRAINDVSHGGISPVPIGLIFVGNNDFVLQSSHGRESVLTAAFADRLMYSEELTYADVTNDDIALYLETKAEFEPKGLRVFLEAFRRPNVSRSFRNVDRFLDSLVDEIGDGVVTASAVRHVLALA